jgi:uncharacterized membrane protein
MKFILTTAIGGILFLVPLSIFVLVVIQVAGVMIIVAEPMAEWLPIRTFGGVILANVMAVIAVILLCFLAGLLARLAFASRTVARLESKVLTKLPGYLMIKSLLAGLDPKQTEQLLPVMVNSGVAKRFGFEVQKLDESQSMVFLPSVPNPFQGITQLYPASEITYLDVPVSTMFEMTENFGHGVNKVLPPANE